MSKLVEFIKNYPPYNSGERASFDDEEAKDLINRNLARPVKKKTEEPAEVETVEEEENQKESTEENEEEIPAEIEQILEEFYSGNGWYEFPELDKKKRKEDAIEYIKDELIE